MIDAFLKWIGFGLCHQLPQRSFFAGGHQVPVCARDTGIYLGFVLSMLVLWTLSRGKRASEVPRPAVLGIAAVFVGAMVADGVSSYAGWRTTTNELRLITGLMAGWAVPVLLYPILNGQLWRRAGAVRVPDGSRELAAWLLPLPVAFVVIRWPMELIGLAYPLLVAAAILATFTLVNLAIVSVVPAAEGRAERGAQLLPWVAVAFVLTVLEISAASWLRFSVVALLSR